MARTHRRRKISRWQRLLAWYRRQPRNKQAAVILLVCFIGALILGILIWTLSVSITFFAELVSSSGLNVGGGLHIHHGLIGMIIFALSFFAVWWHWNNKPLVIILGVAAFIGLMLMLHDAFAYSDTIWNWITFS